MKVVVTGASGFIGKRAAIHLAQLGHEVVAAGRDLKKAKDLENHSIRFVRGDLLNTDYCLRLCVGAEAIIHCAGFASDHGTYEQFYYGNVVATETLVSAAKTSGVKRFINLSSPSIYFQYSDQTNITESQIPKKIATHYGATKLISEQAVAQAHNQDLLTVSLRPRFVIGAGDQNIFPRLLAMQASGRLRRVGNGSNEISVTTVGNLIDVIVRLLSASPSVFGNAYNIANLKPENFWNLVDTVMLQMNLPKVERTLRVPTARALAFLMQAGYAIFQPKKESPLTKLKVAVLHQSMTLNISKAQMALNYMPKYSTEDGIREFADWWRQREA